jgi:hypothetical protein
MNNEVLSITMTIHFEVGSTNYEKDKELVIKTLDDLQARFKISDGYHLGQPISKFGWTFFSLYFKSNLLFQIEEKLSDMIKKSKGHKPQEKLANFMSDFFESRGCKIKLKILDD